MSVLEEVHDEMSRQLELWGVQSHPDGTGRPLDRHDLNFLRKQNEKAVQDGTLTWRLVLLEEVYEAVCEIDPAKLRTELLQVAAVCASWVNAIDRRGG